MPPADRIDRTARFAGDPAIAEIVGKVAGEQVEHRGHVVASYRMPPVSGVGTPVVPGKVIGRSAWQRAARNAIASASMKSTRNPYASTGSQRPRRAASAAISTGLWQQPPQASKRSEENKSELQSLMRNSYTVFCCKKKYIESNVV